MRINDCVSLLTVITKRVGNLINWCLLSWRLPWQIVSDSCRIDDIKSTSNTSVGRDCCRGVCKILGTHVLFIVITFSCCNPLVFRSHRMHWVHRWWVLLHNYVISVAWSVCVCLLVTTLQTYTVRLNRSNSVTSFCTKNYWNRTITVKVVVGGWVEDGAYRTDICLKSFLAALRSESDSIIALYTQPQPPCNAGGDSRRLGSHSTRHMIHCTFHIYRNRAPAVYNCTILEQSFV